jgi:arabinan endo-1,5-alpha-L-arabinosidase
MQRRKFLRVAGVGTGLGLAGCSGGSDETTTDPRTDQTTQGVATTAPATTTTPEGPRYRNPVFEPILADPTLIRTDDGTFYAYGTEDNWHDGEGPRVAPTVRSEDLVEWEYVGEAFDSKPDWKENGYIWAPEVERIDGEWIMYYAYSEWGDENPGIGVATADSPEGSFTDQGKLFDSESIGVDNSIDPFYYEDDGTPYLFWGSFNGIHGIELSADGRSLAGEKFQIAGDRYEAAYIFKREGTYYLMVSSGSCCDGPMTTYQVEVGRSESLRGPYVNHVGDELSNYPGRIVVGEGEQFDGPGHNTMAVDDAGNRWLVYHAYDRDEYWIRNTPRRPMLIDPIEWVDGWPQVPGQTPNVSGPAPEIDGA